MKINILAIELQINNDNYKKLKEELVFDFAEINYEKSILDVIKNPEYSSCNIIIISDYYLESTNRCIKTIKAMNKDFKIIVLSNGSRLDEKMHRDFIANGADSYFSCNDTGPIKNRIHNIYLRLAASENNCGWSECTKKVMKLLYHNFNKLNDKYLETISSMVDYSSSSISHKVKDETGKSIKEWLFTIKSDKAIELLKTTDFQIKFISNLLGYKSVQGFIKSLKKRTGKTPVEIRKGR